MFDASLCIVTIEHVNDPELLINEMKRVCRSFVIISTESYFENERQKDEFKYYLREAHPQLFQKHGSIGTSDVNHFTREDFESLLGTDELMVSGIFKDGIMYHPA
jgi:ubiquinone/menaquinone biosynthesis C-methylase UbiE